MNEPDPDPEHSREALHAAALALRCPRCGVEPGVSCIWSATRLAGRHYLDGLHAERLSLAAGGPAKMNTRRRPPRGWGQRRADPTLRVRRLNDDEQVA